MIDGLVIDNFAGGGGASTGIEAALGRPIDIAINHDPEAVAVHAANHPDTIHYCRNIWQADPETVVREAGGGPVALAWFSPDCKHFSKAKGGRPVKRSIRDLAWVVVLWGKRARPRVIMLENVEEFRDWGPVNLDGRPCPDRRGETFNRWAGELRRLGYRVQWRNLRGCDYGAPTIRKRLFMIARCDGLPIVWPEPTHGPGLLPYRTAADLIDWSIPCPSIFERKRPLADATLRRIAKGIMRYVVEAERPFVVPATLIQTGYGERPGQEPRVPGLDKPLGTVVAGGAKHALVAAHLQRDFGNSVGHRADVPLGTVTAGGGGKAALVAAFLAQHNTGMTGHDAREPVSTITQRGTQQALVASHMINLKGSDRRMSEATRPCPAVTAGGKHLGEVRAFLMKYYGTDQDPRLNEPLHTLTTKDRFGVVTVEINGEPWAIADIGMRMLTPRELFRAQGFRDDYIIAPELSGKPISKTAQIRLAGNSVCPPVAEAMVRANLAAAGSVEMANVA